MRNMVVAHYSDGRILKGFAVDFFPNKPSFHVEREATGEMLEVQIPELKGIFFVKSFEGDGTATRDSNVERPGLGKKIQVDFSDGETLVGYTSGYSAAREGFFVFPIDPNDNNEKVYVVTAATSSVNFL